MKYAKDILAALEAAVSSKRSAVSAPGKKGKKGKKGKNISSLSKQMDGASDAKPEDANWGLFEPVRPILGPVFDILKPLATGNVMYAFLVGLLLVLWFSGRGSKVDVGGWGVYTPQRIAAYEEIWRREESDLWDWLEERVGMERLHEVAAGEAKVVKGRLRNDKMEQREVEQAIKVTEERLRVLKEVVAKESNSKSVAREQTQQPEEDL